MKYIKSLLALALTALLGVTTFAASSDYTGYRTSVASGTPQAVMLSFYDGPTSRGFTWQTDTSVSSGSVWLRQGNYSTKAQIVDSAEMTATATTQSHSDCTTYKANVSGLAEGLWSYCLGNGDNVVLGQFTVKAAPTGPITIVNVNDVQTKDSAKLSYWQNTVIAITNQLDSLGTAADFILSGGDFIDQNQVENQSFYVSWGVVADVARPAFGSLPWIMARGNHDQSYYNELVSENFGTTGCHGFDYGNVHVATLPLYSNSSLSSTVANWLAADLSAAASAKWRIVILHAGPYTTGDHAAEAAFITSLTPILATYEVDLVLQAHDHTYSKTKAYLWSGNGYTGSLNDGDNVNLSPTPTNINSVVYDLNPEGTYYLSAGCAGHRLGENAAIASGTYNNMKGHQTCKIVIATNNLTGANASQDLEQSMFGVLTVDGDKLAYDWYTVDPNGQPALFDTLRVCKTAAASDAGSGDSGSGDSGSGDSGSGTVEPPSGNYVMYGSQYISYTGDSVEKKTEVGTTKDTILIFKADGTFTLPNDATARILVVGGGGGGCMGKKGSSKYSGNGGDGGYAEEYERSLSGGATYTIDVGSGGSGCSDAGGEDYGAGQAGVGSSITGPSLNLPKDGGNPGTTGVKTKSSSTATGEGSAGANNGCVSDIAGNGNIQYGKGGSSPVSNDGEKIGAAGTNYGDGGGGSANGGASGAGHDGVVIVRITSMVQPAKDPAETFTLTYGKSKVVTTSESIATVDPASSSLVTVTPNGATTTFTAGNAEGGPESFRLLNSAGELIKIVTVSVEDPNKKSVTLFWSEIEEYILSTEDGSSAEWTAKATDNVRLMSNGSPVESVEGSGSTFTLAICGYTANGTGKVEVTRGGEKVMTYNVSVLDDFDEKVLYSQWSNAVKYATAYVGEGYVRRFYHTEGNKRWRYADGDYNTATRTVYTYTQTDKADVTPNPVYESGKDYTATSQTFEFTVTGEKAGVVKLAGFFGSSTTTSPKHYAATFELTLIEPIDVPTGAALTYTGSEQTGLSDGEGYTVSGGISKATAVGTYVAIVTPKTNYCWKDKTTDPKTVTWTIGKKTVTVTAKSYDLARGDAVPDYAADATYTGFEGSDTKSVLTTPVSFACDYTTSSPFGTYDVVPSGGEAANYTFEYVNGKVRVREAVTISVLPTVTGELTYGQTLANLTLTGGKAVNSSSEEVAGSFAFVDTAIRPSVADSGTTPYAIVFTPTDETLYKSATSSVTVTVNRKSVSVTADNKNIDEGDDPPTYTATYSGWITGEGTNVLTKVPTFSCPYAGEAGSYDITPSGAEAANYTFNYVKGTLTVAAKTVKQRISSSNTSDIQGTDSQPVYIYKSTSKTGTLTIPKGYVATAEVLVVGGGGGGGGAKKSNTTYYGSGGQGGYVNTNNDDPCAIETGTLNISIGEGASGGEGDNAGSKGGTSKIEGTGTMSFTPISAEGGAGGEKNASSPSDGKGAGGKSTSRTGVASDIISAGTSVTYASGGRKGSGTDPSPAAGENGTGDGGGGAAKNSSKSATTGQDGGDGIVIIKITSLKKVVTKTSEITLFTTSEATDLSAPSAFGAACKWSADSGKTSVATVEVNDSSTSTTTPSIKITPVAVGTATITVKNTDKTDSCDYTWTVTVTVEEPPSIYTYKGREIGYKNATFDESSAPGELIIKFTDTSAAGLLVLPEETTARILVVGGGAGGVMGKSGGSKYSGNGGNSGSVTETDGSVNMRATTYTITVGAGGHGVSTKTNDLTGDNPGEESSISGSGLTTLTAAGGVEWKSEDVDETSGGTSGNKSSDGAKGKDGSSENFASDIAGEGTVYYGQGGTSPSAASGEVNGQPGTNYGDGGGGSANGGTSGAGANGIVIIRLTYRDSLFVKDPIVFSGITYGQSLADSTWQSGSVTNAEGAAVSGTFAWTTTSTKPAVADSDTTPYYVTFTPNDSSTYSAVTFKSTVTVTPAVLTATANSPTIIRGDAVPTYTATYTGFVNGEDESVVTTKAVWTCDYTTSSPAGEYPITMLTAAVAANYTFNYVPGTLKVRDRVTVPAVQMEVNDVRQVQVENVSGDLTEQPTSSAPGVATIGNISKAGTTLTFDLTGVSVGSATVTFETADAVYSLAVTVVTEIPKEDPAAATLKDNGTAPWSCTTTYAAKEWKVWFIDAGSEEEAETSEFVTATVNPASSATAVTTTLTITGKKAGTTQVVLRGDNKLVKVITVTVSEVDKDETITLMASESTNLVTIARAKKWTYQMDTYASDRLGVDITRQADATAKILITTDKQNAATDQGVPAVVQIYGDGELIKTIYVTLTKKDDRENQTIYINADTTWTYTTAEVGSSWTLQSTYAEYASCEVQKNGDDTETATATISITGISPNGTVGVKGYKEVKHTIKKDGEDHMTITVMVRAAEETLSLACGASVDKSGSYAASSPSNRHWAYEGGDPEFDKVGLQILNGSTDLTATSYSGSKTCNYKHATSDWENDITMRLTAKQKVGTEVIKVGRWHENDSAAIDSYIYTVNVYDTATLNVTLDAGDTATLDCSSEIAAAWEATSADPTVATVEEFGDPSTTFKPVVTGLKQGSTTLTVKNDYRVYTVNVTVNAGTETKNVSVEKDQSISETCSFTEAQTWTAASEAEGVATIGVPGGSVASVQATISGVTVGDAVCNVYRSGRSKPAYTYNVTVFERKDRQAMLTIGKAETVTCQSALAAQWSATSSNPTVATVSDFGASDTIFKPVVTCLAEGTTDLYIENAYVKYTYHVQVVKDVQKIALTVEKGKSIETNLTTSGSSYWSVSNQVGWTQATVTVDEGPAASTTATVTGLKGGDSQWTVSLRSAQNDDELPAYILNIKVWESKTANLTLVEGETSALVCEAECPSAWTATSDSDCVTVVAQGASSTTFNPQITGAHEGTATVTVRNDYVVYTITVTVSSHYDQLRAAFADPDSVGNVFQLSQAITDAGEDEPLSIPAGKTLTLDLYGLRLALSRPIEVRGTLTIVNSIDATFFETLSSGRIIGTGTGAVIHCYDGATLTLSKGLVGSFDDTTPAVGTQYGTAIVAEGASEVTLGAQAQLCAKTLVSAEGTATVAIEGGEYRSGMIPFVFGGNAVGTMTGGVYADTTFNDVTALATTNDTAQFTVQTGVCARVASFHYMRPLAADAAAQAVEDEPRYNFRVVTAVASYNGENYASVNEAVEVASETTGSESAVKVLVDTDEKIVIPEGSTVTIDPNGKEIAGGVENNGTMDIKIPDEVVSVGSTQVVFEVLGKGKINAITTTDTSKEVVYEKEGSTVTATVRTSADVLGQTKPDGNQSLTNKIDKLREFLLENKVEAYTKAHTTAAEISEALNEKKTGTGENTLELWKDYALGITPTTPVAPVAAPTGDTDKEKITLAIPDVAAAQDRQSGDYTITYQVVEGGETKATSSDAGSIKVPLATGTYTIKAVFTPKTK